MQVLNIPIYSTYSLESNPSEGSISAWKTETAGPRQIRIIDGSDGNEARVGKVFEAVRYEYGGAKIIYRDN